MININGYKLAKAMLNYGFKADDYFGDSKRAEIEQREKEEREKQAKQKEIDKSRKLIGNFKNSVFPMSGDVNDKFPLLPTTKKTPAVNSGMFTSGNAEKKVTSPQVSIMQNRGYNLKTERLPIGYDFFANTPKTTEAKKSTSSNPFTAMKENGPYTLSFLKYTGKQILGQLYNSIDDAENFFTDFGDRLKTGVSVAGNTKSKGGNPLIAAQNIINSKEIAEQRQRTINKAAETGQKWKEYFQTADIEHPDLTDSQRDSARAVGHVGGVLPMVAISAVNPVLGKVVFGSQVAGGATREALSEGADYSQAINYGVLKAGTELGVEKLVGGLPFMKGIADKPTKSLISKMFKHPVAKGIANYAINAFGEGAEEVVSELLTPVLKSISYDKNAKMPTAEELTEAFIGGAVVSGILGAPSTVVDIIKNSSEYNTDKAIDNYYSDKLSNGLFGKADNKAVPNLQDSIVGDKASTSDALTVPNFFDVKHTPEMQKTIKEYNNYNDSGLVEFAKNVLNETESRIINNKNHPLSETKNKEIQDIKNIIGVDTTGFNHNIKGNSIMHINKRHGLKGEQDHSMADISNIGKIQYVLDNYDSVERLLDEKGNPVYSDEFRNSDGTHADMLLYKKKVNGTYYLIEATPDSKAKKLQVTTAYIQPNKKGASQVLNMPNDPQLTSKTPVANTPSNNIITQDNNIVKDNVPNFFKDYSQYNENYSSENERWTAQNKNEGNKNIKTENIGQIVSDMKKDFGFPINTKNIQSKDAKGIFKVKPETIRTQIANSLPTISHELGHGLDKRYGLSKSDNISEITSAFSEFIEKYPDLQKPNEAVAEFIRTYLQDKVLAKQIAPNYYSEFLSKLNSNDMRNINKYADKINNYMNLSVEERLGASIVNGEKGKEIPNFFDRQGIDMYHAIKRFTKQAEKNSGNLFEGKNDPYKLAMNSLDKASTISYIINEGMTDLNGNVLNDKSYKDILKRIKSKNAHDFSKYLVAKHAPSWLESGKRVFSDDIVNQVEEMKILSEKFENEHPEFKTAAQELYAYQRTLLKNFLVDGGLMTPELFSKLNEMYPYYVPFNRDVDSKKTRGAKAGFANQSLPLSRASGSGLDIIDPLKSIMLNTEKIVKASTRNRVMQSLTRLADTVDGMGNFIEKVPPDMLPRTVSTESIKAKLDKAIKSGDMQVDTDVINQFIDEIVGDSITEFSPFANMKKGIVTVYEKGQPQYYQVNDIKLLESLTNLNPKQLTGATKVFRDITKVSKVLITQLNPMFAIGSNAPRDIMTAYTYSETSNPFTFGKDLVMAYKEMRDNSEDYKRYKAIGGGNGSELSATRDLMKKTLREVELRNANLAVKTLDKILHPIDLISDLGDLVETSNRYAEFKRKLKKTGDSHSALYASDEITTNFKRRGTTSQQYDAFFMFGNASVQGLDRLARQFTDGGAKQAVKTSAKLLISSLLTTALMGWWNRDDEDDYNNLSSYMKNNFYNFSLGNGKFARIPKARELGIPAAVLERAYEYAQGNSEAFHDFGNYLATNLLIPGIPSDYSSLDNIAHDVLGDTFAGPAADLMSNKDFKGSPIVPGNLQNVNQKDQYNSRTTQTAYWLGQITGLSPIQIDHIINSSGGIVGRVNKALFPMDKENKDFTFGLRNQFVADSYYSTDIFNNFYNDRDATNKNYNSNKDDFAMAEKDYALNKQGDFIAKYKKISREYEGEDGRKAEKALLDYVKSNKITNKPFSNELQRLYAVSDDREYLPYFVPSDEIAVKKNKDKIIYSLSAENMLEIQNELGHRVDERYSNTINSDSYKKLSDEGKIKELVKAKKEVEKQVLDNFITKYNFTSNNANVLKDYYKK